jgi:hypothetical protein
MTDTDTADTSEAAEQIQTEVVDAVAPMTIEEAQAKVDARKSARQGEQPEAEEAEEEASEEEAEEEAEEAEGSETKEESEEGVLSHKEYVESLDQSGREDLAIELGSGLGKLAGSNRKLIRELKSQLVTANEAKEAAIKLAPSADVPFPELRTVESVDAKIEEIDEMLTDWGDRMTFEQTEKYDEASGQDVKGVEKDGQFYTLKALKEWRDNQRKALKGLRGQKAGVRKLEKLFEDEDVRIETNKVDLGIEEGSKASELYESYLSDAQFQVLKVQMPELASKLLDTFAHAAINQGGDSVKKKPAKRKAPKARNSNSVPKGGVGSISSQGQVSMQEKIARDPNRSPAERQAAARAVRQLKRNT